MRIRRLLALALLMVFPLVGLGGVASALPPAVPDQPVLVIGMTGMAGLDRAIQRAGGYRIGPTDPPLGYLAHSHDPEFLPRLRATRRYLLLNATALPDFLCDPNG